MAAVLTITGNVGTVKPIKSGETEFLVVNVAVNQGKGNEKRAVWYEVRLFGKLMNVGQYLSTGRKVLVMGDLEEHPYKKSDGSPALGLRITASKIELLDSAPKA